MVSRRRHSVGPGGLFPQHFGEGDGGAAGLRSTGQSASRKNPHHAYFPPIPLIIFGGYCHSSRPR